MDDSFFSSRQDASTDMQHEQGHVDHMSDSTNMTMTTYLGDLVTLTQGKILNLTFRVKKIGSTLLNERKAKVASLILYHSQFNSYSWTTSQKPYSDFFDLWNLNRWPEVNSDKHTPERAVQEQPIAFSTTF